MHYISCMINYNLKTWGFFFTFSLVDGNAVNKSHSLSQYIF